MDRPRRSDCTAGHGEAGWWTTSGNIGLPPLERVMGVGRQQHVFDGSRSKILQVEDAEFVRVKGLQLLIALLTRSVVNVCAISKDFLFVSLVTNRVSLEEVCLPSFGVLNCWLNLVASCLDDENEIPLKVIALFSASRFALPSIPLIVLHSLVTSVFWSKVSTKSLHFCLLCT